MRKKVWAGVLAAIMAISPLSPTAALVHAEAAPASHVVTAEKTADGNVVIGNDYMERTFTTTDNHLATKEIVNKRTDNGKTVFTPGKGSEEFIVRVTKDPKEAAAPAHPALDRTDWTAVADSYHNKNQGDSDGPAQNLLDGNLNTIWHSNYGGGTGTGDQEYPHNVIIDMKKGVTFQCFSYTPRQQGESTNGNILGYQLWTSNKSEKLEVNDSSWEMVKEGNFKYDGVAPIYVNLDAPKTARQVKLVATSAKNGQKFAGGAEFNLHEKPYEAATKNDREFFASELTLQDDPVITDTDVTINKVKKHGKKVTFNFAPHEFKGVTYTISENIVMYDGDHFMRKFLEISVPEADKQKATIDFIDLESLKLNEGDKQWTIPTGKGGIVSMEEYRANLGQPIYIQGMFFGCEFPVTDTQIVDGTGRMRYYSGKNFERLGLDNQLTKDGKYVTWQTVAGAARSTDQQVVQADFFEYIKTISVPTEFRLQYNSWFDNMMKIDDKNIYNSFIEVDRELNKAETRPLDSYVADDGWNNYNKDSVVDAERSGTTMNESGFWEFNSKFPNEFTPASELVQKFGSNFGTWVGPRGGYNFYGTLADILTKSGKGSKAGGSVDVADREYIKNFAQMAMNFQEKFHINYWKWDGFADDGQYNQFPAQDGVPGYENRHMTGGYHHMYHVTDLWEGWTDLIETVRANAEKNHIDNLWISLTCYTNPSPWFLQWGNSVWLQCLGDQRDAAFGQNKMDKQMTYRDANYYDFLKNHQFQFPLSNLYNHDPIYGVEGTGMNFNTATDEVFQNYLYMMATRGNAFWELHYSDKIMTEGKYAITSEFTRWAEENYHMLKNSKMIGGQPDITHLRDFDSDNSQNENNVQAYGYSCFDGTDGIISLRNPATNGERTIEFTFDRTMGVQEDAGELNYHVEHSYQATEEHTKPGKLTYGQKCSFTLKPNEVLILRVSKNGDTTAPAFKRAYTDGKNVVTVKFDEKVKGNNLTINGKTVTVEKVADDLTYNLTVAEPLTNGETLTITAEGITDMAGNALANKTITTVYYKDNLAVKSEQAVAAETNLGQADLSDDGFTMNAVVTEAKAGAVLKHGDKAELGVQADGKAYFKLDKATAVSEAAVAAGSRITGVKENNGIIKLYVNGELSSSAYDKDNRYLALGNAAVAVANADSAEVYTEGLGYDVVKDLGAPIVEDNTLDTTGMKVEVSGTTEGDKANIFDNNPETFWNSNNVTAVAKGDPYLIVDLGKEYMLNGVDYTKRYANQANAYWKCTGNLRKYFLEVSTDKEHWTTVSSGDTFADEALNEKGNGGTTTIRFEPVKAKYIRLSSDSTYHWKNNKLNTSITVGDLKLYGKEAVLENLALNKTGLTAKFSDGTDAAKGGDRPLSMVVDGKSDDLNGNYGEFGADGNTKGSYFQVDLEKLCDISSIKMYRYWGGNRTYRDTVVVVSDTEAGFNAPETRTVIFNSDANNVHGFGAGEDQAYAESAEGHTFTVPAGTQARYVRVYMHGQSDTATTNHINELEVMGNVASGDQPVKPTAAPTEKPTAAPTEKPTAAPTTAPTAVPTEKPTAAPTTAPTAEPTAKPTEQPTEVPTDKPEEKTGWVEVNGGWKYRNEDGSYVVDDWLQLDGIWYYCDAEGFMLTGWQDLSTGRFYFDQWGHMSESRWEMIDGKFYYFNEWGHNAINRWEQVDGLWYWFDAEGQMVIDWNYIDGNWYYFDIHGTMLKDWQRINDSWFYFNESGHMLTGWQWINGSWFYMNEWGQMAESRWEMIDGTFYYFNEWGQMATNWQYIDGVWYYFNQSGQMLTGWQWIDGNCYYFYSSGTMAANTTIDGSYVNGSGVWVA